MPRGNKPHTPEARAKISKTMTGRKLSKEHKQAIAKGHASNKESGAFYWSEEYKAKQSKPKKGCKEAALRQHYGRIADEWIAEQEAKTEVYNKPIDVPVANNRPDWLKDYI